MTGGELLVEGRAFLGEEMEDAAVRIVIEDGVISQIEEVDGTGEELPWIIPAFFNAHTHVGDSVALDIPLEGDLDSVVRPPDGQKHRILRSTRREELVRAMRLTLGVMAGGGTAGFADFREGGEDGVSALLEAAEGVLCRPVIFGREGGEAIAHGLGVSSARDVLEGLGEMVATARKLGRLVAFHAGERDAGDIDCALDYEPDLLVHCTHATREQLRRIADLGIPVAVCPRANWKLGVTSSPEKPPVHEILDLEIPLLLGTDNAMCVQPDMWREMEFLATVYRLPPRDVLRAATLGASLFSDSFFIREKNRANFLFIEPRSSNLVLSRDIAGTLVNRGCAGNIVRKVINL